jgi:hypothetical protein
MAEHGSPLHAESQGAEKDVEDLVERAFHYRGDVTIQTDNDDSLTGYLFNRDARASEPFAQLFETETGREIYIPYRDITQVLFTGRDVAAASVKHFEAFQDRQDGTGQTGSRAHRKRTE